jgi:hypothetical protein
MIARLLLSDNRKVSATALKLVLSIVEASVACHRVEFFGNLLSHYVDVDELFPSFAASRPASVSPLTTLRGGAASAVAHSGDSWLLRFCTAALQLFAASPASPRAVPHAPYSSIPQPSRWECLRARGIVVPPSGQALLQAVVDKGYRRDRCESNASHLVSHLSVRRWRPASAAPASARTPATDVHPAVDDDLDASSVVSFDSHSDDVSEQLRVPHAVPVFLEVRLRVFRSCFSPSHCLAVLLSPSLSLRRGLCRAAAWVGDAVPCYSCPQSLLSLKVSKRKRSLNSFLKALTQDNTHRRVRGARVLRGLPSLSVAAVNAVLGVAVRDAGLLSSCGTEWRLPLLQLLVESKRSAQRGPQSDVDGDAGRFVSGHQARVVCSRRSAVCIVTCHRHRCCLSTLLQTVVDLCLDALSELHYAALTSLHGSSSDDGGGDDSASVSSPVHVAVWDSDGWVLLRDTLLLCRAFGASSADVGARCCPPH